MDFDSLSEFNKYTLALAAAAFVYSLEKFVPADTVATRNIVLVLLTILLVSSIMGVLIFAAATAGKHAKEANKRDRLDNIRWHIGWMGWAHSGLLLAGLVLLGFMIFQRILDPPAAAAPPCCCQACPTDSGISPIPAPP